MNLRLRSGIFFLFTLLFFCCNRSHTPDTTKHYSEDVIHRFEKISDQQKNRDSSIRLLDSLYKTFPHISVADKYRYYDFKRKLFELIRYGKRSYDTAIIYTDSMIAVIEDNGLTKKMHNEYIKAFSIRGEYFTRRQRYSNAIRDITRCKQLNEEVGDSCLMGENTKTLSSIAIMQSDYSLAASLIKEALLLISTCKNDQQQFVRKQRYLDDLGFIYSRQKKYDSSAMYHLAAMNYVNENKRLSPDTLFPYVALENIYGNLGFALYYQNKFPEAEFYLKKAMSIDQDILHDSVSLGLVQYILGMVYLKSGLINEAESMVQKSRLQINRYNSGARYDLLSLEADIAKEKKQYREEAKYRAQMQIVKDSIDHATIELLTNNPFTEYEQLDKKYQVELLKKDNRIQQNKTNAAIVIGGLLTLLAGISFFLLRRLRTVMKKRAIVYNKLVASESELKETMVQKETAEKALRENELFAQEMLLQMEFNKAIIEQRRQISDDMHDELSNSLAALKFYVANIRNRAINTDSEKTLSEIEEEVSAIYISARNYMHSLKTNNWETRFSLIGFLKEIQQKFSEKALMVVKLDIEEDNIKVKLSSHQHDQLYHIVRESISNVIKHAAATELKVAIRFKNENCVFSISDNGKGFEQGKIVHGIGMESIQKRIKDIGGQLQVESSFLGVTVDGFFPVY